MTTETWLAVIAVVQIGGFIVLAVLVSFIAARGRELMENLNSLLDNVRNSLFNVDNVVRDLKEQQLIAKASAALEGASGAVTRIDPLVTDLTDTLSNARGLLDDATQTSQSVRARVDDLAATQNELNTLTGSLTDIASQLRDADIGNKLGNILHDASLLAADVGMLTENVNHYLETGKPLVKSLSGVVNRTKKRAEKVTDAIGGLKEGIKAGADAARGEG